MWPSSTSIVDTGVANVRDTTPSRRAWISAVAPVSEDRNTKSSSCCGAEVELAQAFELLGEVVDPLDLEPRRGHQALSSFQGRQRIGALDPATGEGGQLTLLAAEPVQHDTHLLHRGPRGEL